MTEHSTMAKDLNLANTANRAHLPVAKGYTVWASTYDRDHNPLQAVDTIMLRKYIPEFLKLSTKSTSAQQRLQLVDLGCGTGRNTAQLLSSIIGPQRSDQLFDQSGVLKQNVSVLGMDLTPAMLEVAEHKCTKLLDAADGPARAGLSVHFRQFNMLAEEHPSDITSIPWGAADGVLSSLVIEHVPAPVFFATCAALLKPGGYLLATNMHPDMGDATGSGYTDQRTGRKVRIEGYNHSVQEFADEAKKAGFTLLSNSIQETAPTAEMVSNEEILRARGSKWIGTKIWMGAMWRKA